VPALPSGYSIARATMADADSLASVLKQAFTDDSWKPEKVKRELLTNAEVDTTYVVREKDGKVVATASVRVPPSDQFGGAGELHWVAVSPGHRGQKLGLIVSWQVMKRFQELGRQVVLRTDDFRLAAIKTYLNLGFRPELTSPDHCERWQTVFKHLGIAQVPFIDREA